MCSTWRNPLPLFIFKLCYWRRCCLLRLQSVGDRWMKYEYEKAAGGSGEGMCGGHYADSWKPKYSERDLSQCHFFHYLPPHGLDLYWSWSLEMWDWHLNAWTMIHLSRLFWNPSPRLVPKRDNSITRTTCNFLQLLFNPLKTKHICFI
jgi:hypothetical protein